jgi:hypothetical protein
LLEVPMRGRLTSCRCNPDSSIRRGAQVADHPDGPSATDTVCPVGMPLGAFRGNSAHSNGRYGLRIFNMYFPRTHPCLPITTESADVAANPQVRRLPSSREKNPHVVGDGVAGVRMRLGARERRWMGIGARCIDVARLDTLGG